MASTKAGSNGASTGKTNGASVLNDGRSAPTREEQAAGGPSSSQSQSDASERRVLNTIRPVRARQPLRDGAKASNGVRAAEPPRQRAPKPSTADRDRASARQDTDTWSMPEAVKARFTQDGQHWYFPDGERAFRDHGRRLSTSTENAEVIASLIDIAKARGWQSISIGGSERFRQEVWKQGKLAGLEVRGYRPSDPERAAMIRALGRRADATRQPQLALGSSGRTDEKGGAVEAGAAKEGARRDDTVVGKLLDHGADHYGFNPRADLSYFARIDTAQGKRVIWGVDLERAIRESLSQPKLGDDVVLRHRGSEPVTVVRQELDEQGKILSDARVSAHRNSWSVETAAFLAGREAAAKALRDGAQSPKEVTRNHPELAGTVLQIEAAEQFARRFHDPRERKEFVEMVRAGLANRVAHGEPLRPVRLVATREKRAAVEKEQAPVR